MADKMMNYKDKIQHPWQSGPTELMAHAIEHLHKGTEFDNRIAFLLFDVGVETLFKTYLLLSDDIVGKRLTYNKRRDYASGTAHSVDDEKKHPKRDLNFNDLIKGMELIKPDITKEFDLAHIEFFHAKRNSLYHDGNGITIEVGNLKSYSLIAVKLLMCLLDIDLSDLLHSPDVVTELAEAELSKWETIASYKQELKESCKHLGEITKHLMEIIAPDIATGIFIRTLKKSYELSGVKAEVYYQGAVKKALANKQVAIPSIDVESFLQDPNNLYLPIVDEVVQTENTFNLYQLSKYDPDDAVPHFHPVDIDETGNVIYKEQSADERIDEISNWLLDLNADINKKIAAMESWLDKQELFKTTLLP
jgi:hypothetical protein